MLCCQNGGFPELGVPFWGVPIIRTIVYLDLHWGPLFWETTKYHRYPKIRSARAGLF